MRLVIPVKLALDIVGFYANLAQAATSLTAGFVALRLAAHYYYYQGKQASHELSLS